MITPVFLHVEVLADDGKDFGFGGGVEEEVAGWGEEFLKTDAEFFVANGVHDAITEICVKQNEVECFVKFADGVECVVENDIGLPVCGKELNAVRDLYHDGVPFNGGNFA